jgi:hypothetical protein
LILLLAHPLVSHSNHLAQAAIHRKTEKVIYLAEGRWGGEERGGGGAESYDLKKVWSSVKKHSILSDVNI